MENKNIFSFKWDYKNIMMLIILVILPNLVGTFNYTTIFGLRVHFFQIFVFLAAMLYGPVGGMISGGVGSFYVALAMNNPYIIIGNVILGFMTGYLYRKRFNLIVSALFAYIIQVPWLWVSDVYLANMPIAVVNMVVVSLFISNIVWASVAHFLGKGLK